MWFRVSQRFGQSETHNVGRSPSGFFFLGLGQMMVAVRPETMKVGSSPSIVPFLPVPTLSQSLSACSHSLVPGGGQYFVQG